LNFRTLDISNTGFVTLGQVRQLIQAILNGNNKGDIPDPEVDALFDELDLNGDGFLSTAELQQSTGGESPIHSADQDADQLISLSELLRVIQFYNTGGYACSDVPADTEDGYIPGAGADTCVAHASDYNPQDWGVDLSELLRVIQLYNTGGYFECEEGEDGYCPGQP